MDNKSTAITSDTKRFIIFLLFIEVAFIPLFVAIFLATRVVEETNYIYLVPWFSLFMIPYAFWIRFVVNLHIKYLDKESDASD